MIHSLKCKKGSQGERYIKILRPELEKSLPAINKTVHLFWSWNCAQAQGGAGYRTVNQDCILWDSRDSGCAVLIGKAGLNSSVLGVFCECLSNERLWKVTCEQLISSTLVLECWQLLFGVSNLVFSSVFQTISGEMNRLNEQNRKCLM